MVAALVFHRLRLPAELEALIYTFLSCRHWAASTVCYGAAQALTAVGSKRAKK
jgi:hypothetical protein